MDDLDDLKYEVIFQISKEQALNFCIDNFCYASAMCQLQWKKKKKLAKIS